MFMATAQFCATHILLSAVKLSAIVKYKNKPFKYYQLLCLSNNSCYKLLILKWIPGYSQSVVVSTQNQEAVICNNKELPMPCQHWYMHVNALGLPPF